MKHYQVIVVGGGTGGIMVAAQLLKKRSKLNVAIFDPSEKHVYQPAYTLVGAGTMKLSELIRSEKSVIPSGADWIKVTVQSFDPKRNTLKTALGDEYSYDYLVVSPGVQINTDLVEGLTEAMHYDNVCSVYTDPEKVWKTIRQFKKGNALFTQPTTPFKCGGAPMKVMFMAEDYFRKNGVRKDMSILFATPGSVIFGVKEFKQTLEEVIQRKEIAIRYHFGLTKVDPVKKKAFYKVGEGYDLTQGLASNEFKIEQTGEREVAIHYDLLHLAPPQEAPTFIQKSPFSYQAGPNKGWMEVDHYSMQHPVFQNVFGVGDAIAVPTAKTGAAIRKQAPVVVDNIINLMEKGELGTLKYDGYSSCPIVTGYGKMLLAEFVYGNVRQSDKLLSTFVDTTKESWLMWILKKYGLPYLYWNQMLKGKM